MDSVFNRATLAWEQGDEHTAFELFHLAAEQGDSNSLLNLGYCYDEGVGTEIDKQKALSCYKRAAENGDVAAYTNMALYYASINDFSQAAKCYFQALEKGDKDVALDIAKLALSGHINLSNQEIVQYLKIVIDAKPMVDVCQATQEEAKILYQKIIH